MLCSLCSEKGATRFCQLDEKIYYRCSNCALIFLDKEYFLEQSEEKKRYLLHENDPNDSRYQAFLSPASDAIREHLSSGAVGLDYGCGPGPALSLALKENQIAIHNYDPFFYDDHSLLERSYDFVVSTECFEHFHCPAKEMGKLFSLLRRQGFLIVMTKTYSDVSVQNFSKDHYPRDPTHVSFYDKKTFVFIAKKWHMKICSQKANVTVLQKC